MTESEWLISDDPQRMLDVVLMPASPRSLRLFSVACVKRVLRRSPPQWWYEDALDLLQFFEDYCTYGDSETDYAELVAEIRSLETEIAAKDCDTLGDDYHSLYHAVVNHAKDAAIWASLHANIALSPRLPQQPSRSETAGTAEAKHQTHLLRCIFGNHYRSIRFERRWLTATVRHIARRTDNDGRFDRMLMLADALENAGCTNEPILRHCRDDEIHTLGCWVLDGILGR